MTKPSPRAWGMSAAVMMAAALWAGNGLAQPAQPAQSMEERLRAQLRNTTAQLQQAQNELAALKAGQSGPAGAPAGKDSPDALRKALEAAQAQLASEKQARERLEQGSRASQSQAQAIADKANAQIAQYRNAYEELLKLARNAEAERKRLGEESGAQRSALALCEAKNAKLYAVGQEILDAYENVGIGTVIASRQPFAAKARVKYEQIAQEYGDKLYEGKFDPRAAAAAAAASAPAAAPAAAPAEQAARQ